MSGELWLNLPVRDPERAKVFYTQLGFRLNEQYASQDGSFSLIVGDNQVVLMFFPESTFKGFDGNAVSDSCLGTEVLFSLGANSRDEVDEFALKAELAGVLYSTSQAKRMAGCMAAVLLIPTDIDGMRCIWI